MARERVSIWFVDTELVVTEGSYLGKSINRFPQGMISSIYVSFDNQDRVDEASESRFAEPVGLTISTTDSKYFRMLTQLAYADLVWIAHRLNVDVFVHHPKVKK